ncbi:putative mRNA capping enzyme, partial [Emiliania huxleyi virus 145]
MRYNDILYTGSEILHLSSYPVPNDHGKLVIDEDKKTFLQHRLTQLTGSTSKNGFPIAQPESFKRSVIPTIINGKFCASLKTDGVRAMLLLTKYNNEFVAVLIDRKLTIREVEV